MMVRTEAHKVRTPESRRPCPDWIQLNRPSEFGVRTLPLNMAFVLLHYKGVIFSSCDSRCGDPESNVAKCIDESGFDRIVLLPFDRRSMTSGADEFSQVRARVARWALREVAVGGPTGEVMIPRWKTSGQARFG